MVELLIRPTLHRFETCLDFVKEFHPGERDLVLTNKYIYEPYLGQMGLPVHTIYQEEYGAGEPTDVMVDAILADAARMGCTRVIAIGGGTVLDIAKILAVSSGEGVDTLFDRAPALDKRLGTKLGLVSPAMYADHAVLIPQLLEGLPFGVFAASSIDALVHAVESSLSPRATPYTKLFGYKAIEMILHGYQRLVSEGREALHILLDDFLVASNFAGIAFGTAGCAAVHAMSYPLGGKYHVAHGESNYAMFTGVLKNYLELRQDGEIAVMNEFLARLLGCGTQAVYDRLEELLNQLLPKRSLHEYGVTRQDLRDFTHSVITGQGRLMDNSFVPLDETRVLKIYTELF